MAFKLRFELSSGYRYRRAEKLDSDSDSDPDPDIDPDFDPDFDGVLEAEVSRFRQD